MTFPRSFGPPGSGGTPRSFGPMARTVDRGGDLSDRELREHAVVLLKQTPLFRRMSWRLLSDLVALEGVQVVHDAIGRIPIDFAVLVVLEGTLIVSLQGQGHSPVDSPVPPPNPGDSPILLELAPGVYLRNDPKLALFPTNDRSIEAPRKQALRYYALESHTLSGLPTQVLAGMDAAAVGGNLEVLLP
jgi:hypothetical protein